jgi:hypothetical protein
MSTQPVPGQQPALPADLAEVVRAVPRADHGTTDSFDVKSSEGYSEEVVDRIEMIGEEQAAGLGERGPHLVTPAMRYLHSSRTIHQLVTDRNRAVGIYLAVASLLVTASSALLNANPKGDLIVPIEEIQRWCLPTTFAALAVLAVFVGFLLIRTRVGLIYEVAKMNALLGLPSGRVSRISPLSLFFIMQAFISLAGGCASGLFSIFMIRLADPQAAHAPLWAGAIGALVALALLLLYIGTVCYTTSDQRLGVVGKP